MRTMVIGRYGPPEVFEVRESPAPTPKPGEALVRIHAVGVGFTDLMQRMGIYPGTPKPPFVPGLEVAGVVELVSTGSPGERPLQVGERVVALPKLSGYAAQVAAPAAPRRPRLHRRRRGPGCDRPAKKNTEMSLIPFCSSASPYFSGLPPIGVAIDKGQSPQILDQLT